MSHAMRPALRTAAGLLLCLLSCFVQIVFAQPALPVSGKTLTLGAGDHLRINVFQNAELQLETRVDGEGRITYPFLGVLTVGGQTPSELEQMIATGLEQKNVLRRPQVSVSLLNYRSQQVAVLGHVNRPGQYVLDMDYTVSGALAQAGGVGASGAETAVLSRIEAGAVRNTEIDLVQMFRPGASRSQDVRVLPGDVLFVHRAPAFYIYGEVQRPGMQRLERDMTVMQALSASGGLTPRGTERGLRITRRAADGTLTTIEVDLATRLMPDDVVQVRESLF